jgi:hypothetical protein
MQNVDATAGPKRNRQAHDLRNSLYLIAGFAQALRDGLVGPVTCPQREILDHVLVCAAKAQRVLSPESAAAVTGENHDA